MMNSLYINGRDSLCEKDKPLLTYVKINAWMAPINIENPCHAILAIWQQLYRQRLLLNHLQVIVSKISPA